MISRTVTAVLLCLICVELPAAGLYLHIYTLPPEVVDGRCEAARARKTFVVARVVILYNVDPPTHRQHNSKRNNRATLFSPDTTGFSRGLPGVYFYYEVSPVQALVEEKRRGLLAFLTGACGAVGGVYTILGLVNAGIDGLMRGGGVAGRRSR